MKLLPRCCLLALLLPSTCDSQGLSPTQQSARDRALARSLSRMVANGGGRLLIEDVGNVRLEGEVAAWIAENKSALLRADASPFAKTQPWGVVTAHDNVLFLHVLRWPDDGKLRLPRLHNSVTRIRLGDKVPDLSLTPLVNEWEIALPAQPEQRAMLLPIVRLELDAAPVVATLTPPTVKPNQEGVLLLHARQAITHGAMLRFEPQPHKNTVGYWVREEDWVEWSFEVPTPMTYEVELRYGCGAGQGGSKISVVVGAAQLSFTVEATGGFQAWRTVKIGRVNLPQGQLALTVKPQRKAENAVMDIQQISLIPVGS